MGGLDRGDVALEFELLPDLRCENGKEKRKKWGLIRWESMEVKSSHRSRNSSSDKKKQKYNVLNKK